MQYRTFNDYVADHPEGESFRNWITNVRPAKRNNKSERRRVQRQVEYNKKYRLALLIFPVGEPDRWNHIPGGYLWATAVKTIGHHKDYLVNAHDDDDGMAQKWVDTEAEALELIENISTLAPMTLRDCVEVLDMSY